MIRSVLFLGGVLACCLLAMEIAPSRAQPPSNNAEDPQPVSNLDDELLESLGGDAVENVGANPMDTAAPIEAPESGRSDLDNELLRELEEDEATPLDDLEQDPFRRIDRRMRRVETLIAETKTGEPTQKLQQEIIAELDELIKQLRQNARQSPSNGSQQQQQQQTAQREQVAQPQPAGQTEGGAEGQSQDSTTAVRKEAAEQARLQENVQDMLRGVWGQLPERVREQMLQSANERYLPKYELMIERYFEELADRPQQP